MLNAEQVKWALIDLAMMGWILVESEDHAKQVLASTGSGYTAKSTGQMWKVNKEAS